MLTVDQVIIQWLNAVETSNNLSLMLWLHEVVDGFDCPSDTRSYVDSGQATGRLSHGGHVKG